MTKSPTEIAQQQWDFCLANAGDLIAAAERVLGSDNGHHNIAYHLATLAIEEIGKAGMIAARAAVGSRPDGDPMSERLDDHVYKFMWAVWSPSLFGGKIDPKNFFDAKRFAESTHIRRMAGLYVGHSPLEEPLAPRDAVPAAQAMAQLEFAKFCLELNLARGQPISDVLSPEREWFLATVGDEVGHRRLFSEPFLKKYEELSGDTHAWVTWAKGEFERVAKEEQAVLERELARQASSSGELKPKWMMRIKLRTPSHIIRPAALKYWNDRIEAIKLLSPEKKKDELIMELTIYDGVRLEELFDAGLSLSKRIIVALNVSTTGFFWYELSGQAAKYYESVRDLENKMDVRIGKAQGLDLEWLQDAPGTGPRRQVALTADLLEHAIQCLPTLSALPEEQAGLIFGPYLNGLTCLSKTDIHLSLAPSAHAAFLASLRAALTHFGDWDGDQAMLIPTMHRVLEPIVKDEGNRNMLFAVLEKKQAAIDESLNAAVSVKRILDLYLVLKANRLWVEFVRDANQKPRDADPGP